MDAGRRAISTRFPGRLCAALALALALLLPTALPAQITGSIAYVDMKRLIDSAPQVLAARDRLQREFEARDRELTAESARLAELDARIRDGEATLPEEELATLRRQAEALRRSIERTRQRLREELDTRIEQEIDQAWPVINDAVADYAREAGIDLVVASPVVYVSGRIDITERVLERLAREPVRSGDPP